MEREAIPILMQFKVNNRERSVPLHSTFLCPVNTGSIKAFQGFCGNSATGSQIVECHTGPAPTSPPSFNICETGSCHISYLTAGSLEGELQIRKVLCL